MDISEETKKQIADILAEEDERDRALLQQEAKSRLMAGANKAQRRAIEKAPLIPERIAPPSAKERASKKKKRKSAREARRRNR